MTDDERTAYIEACPAFGLDEKGESAFDMSTEECQLCEQQDRNTHNACQEEWKRTDPPQAQEVGENPHISKEYEEQLRKEYPPQAQEVAGDVHIGSMGDMVNGDIHDGVEVSEAPKPEKEKQEAVKEEKKLKKFAAAIIVLDKADIPLSCEEIVDRMAEQELWTSSKGNCAAYGLYRNFLIEMKKGDKSRIYRSGKDKYELRRKDGN